MRIGRRAHIPARTCIGCRTRRPKGELLRFVLSPEGELIADRRQRLPGRGVYLCARRSCLQQALQSRGLHRGFRRNVSARCYERLEACFDAIDPTTPGH